MACALSKDMARRLASALLVLLPGAEAWDCGTCVFGHCVRGVCACDALAAGPHCETLLCDTVRQPCANGGRCESGNCTCAEGWGGALCEVTRCPHGCSARGTCSLLNGRTVCACQPGFGGDHCQHAVARCKAGCSGHGVCGADGRCKCHAGYAGATCMRAVPNICIHNCGGHGRCAADGMCLCDSGFGGRDCSRRVATPGCVAGCSGHGLCGPHGHCICEPGFAGAGCERVGVVPPPSPLPPLQLPAPFPVMPFAEALAAVTAAAARVMVSAVRFAPPALLCPANCSGHGQCSRGRCFCHPGFRGAGCELVARRCEAMCSGHGTCGADGRCSCHAGYGGSRCSIMLPAQTCPFHC